MDQSKLVENGHKLIEAMTKADIAPRAAMWVHSTDADVWRLWIVPSKGLADRREFYRRIAELITQHRERFNDFDAGDVELMPDDHPGIVGVSRMVRVKGLSSVHLRDNMVNGFYIPNGIVLLMDI